MKKTTVYLEADIDRGLSQLAAKRGVTKAEVIRAALRNVASRVERPRISAVGVAHGPGDVADNVDRHLSETDFGRP